MPLPTVKVTAPTASGPVVLIGAIVLLVVAVAATAVWRYGEIRARFETEASTLYRLLSQRVDQHDAHLTALSALAQAADPPPREAIAQVAASFLRFYPRIVGVDLVDLAAVPPVSLLSSDVSLDRVRDAIAADPAQTTLVPLPRERLLLLKRVPGSEPTRWVDALTIDLRALVATEPPLGGSVQILLAGRPLLAEAPASWTPLTYEATLTSRSQPLTLRITAPLMLSALVPWPFVLGALVVIALVALAVQRLGVARSLERAAGERARLAAQEARLAHAGRINAMGEMASGIAHELTQPLTAILAQAQAGHRLAARPEPDGVAISSAFEATIRNAKRAGDILGRLRAWVTKRETVVEIFDLRTILEDVVQLAMAQAEALGIDLGAGPAPAGFLVRADRIEIEQVVFNLVINAMDAMKEATGRRRIDLDLEDRDRSVVLSVRDSGPGFSPDALALAFEPFFTTKAEGMGLGLALCTTLVERHGGRITAENAPGGGAQVRVELPLARGDQLAEAAQ